MGLSVKTSGLAAVIVEAVLDLIYCVPTGLMTAFHLCNVLFKYQT